MTFAILVGPLYVNKTPFDWDELEEECSFVKPGGFYSPTHCHPIAKVGLELGLGLGLGFSEDI